MKNNRRTGSLFGLLARNYLMFTLTLLLIAGGVYVLWNAYLNRLYQPADWERLLADPALSSGDYAELERYLYSPGSAFAVYDSLGQRLYATSADDDLRLSAGELDCLSDWDALSYISATDYTDENGEPLHLLTRYSYSDSGDYTEEEHMLLNKSYQVVSGGFSNGRLVYTAREYACLTGTLSDDGELYRSSFSSADGSALTLLLKSVYLTADEYYRGYQASQRLWLLVLPAYALLICLFIWQLSRNIRRPLERLNLAVNAQAQGSFALVGDCGGAWEIRRIGQSLDQLSERLAASEAERQRLDESRQKLIADISHDLKTPVTVISGYADAICDNKLPPAETERYLAVIRSKAAALSQLVDAFHEYSKLEHPDFALHMQRTDVCEFAREYLARKYEEIDLSGFALEVSIPERPLYCRLDGFQFSRLLDNLLNNCLRYNPAGTTVFFDLAADPTTVIIHFADNGRGVPPERAEVIFEPFVTGDDARAGSGSGLGLSITRRIVELHQGSIRLSTRLAPGRSTEFIICLPLDTAR